MPLNITSIEICLILLQIKSFMIEVTQLGKTQMLIKTTFNSYSIIKHQEVRFFVGFQNHSKAKRNILRFPNYIGEIELSGHLSNKVKNKNPAFIHILQVSTKPNKQPNES